jgi:hypothetical protein
MYIWGVVGLKCGDWLIWFGRLVRYPKYTQLDHKSIDRHKNQIPLKVHRISRGHILPTKNPPTCCFPPEFRFRKP